ncbi:DHH family phosphoesterase [Chitinophaga sedimenti]|uniref:DHH family phosphoesterase n=1 Tax=Chitinophaga sedimenti TaxID=2033606 RepID=UPI00200434DD|nr:DHH family phosphoesterase [Chitinophaga sedimenti]MCK7555156.1 DHH family phosphoesterase [Chitinophaga sedimenti]
MVITMHQKPDADAMGSSLALFHYLQQKGHHATVISPTNYPDFLKWMPGCETVIDFESANEKALEAMKGAELIFCLDFNNIDRTKNMAPVIEKSPAIRILVDHHPEPKDQFEYGVSDNTAAATAQMIYEMLYKLGEEKYINRTWPNVFTPAPSPTPDLSVSPPHRPVYTVWWPI